MIVAFAILLPVLGVSLWAYFRFRPGRDGAKSIRIFDALVVGCAVALSIVATSYLRKEMASGPDSAWWPVVSAIYSLVIFPACLLVGGMIRYVVYSRLRMGRNQGAS